MGAGNESIQAMKMGVAMIFLTAVLGFVMFNIFLARGFSEQFFGGIADADQQSINKYFKEAMTDEGISVPMAAVYELAESNINDVESISVGYIDHNGNWQYQYDDGMVDLSTGRRYGKEPLNEQNRRAEIWLRNHLSGKCNLKVEMTNDRTYKMIITLSDRIAES